jgi:hypothetical protein
MMRTGASLRRIANEVIEPSDLTSAQKEALLLYATLLSEESVPRNAEVPRGRPVGSRRAT